MPAIDLFRSGFALPQKVCILAPGPNGMPHYGEIPKDYAVVAVSKAILIKEVRVKHVWMMNHGTQGWFDEANASHQGIRIFSADAYLESQGKIDAADSVYVFTPPPDELTSATVGSVDGSIRYGTTVSGCALQLAFNFGARDILLCGVDMSGDDYWDGTRNVYLYHGDVWPAATAIGALIGWMRDEHGIRVSTLSATKLDVPAFRPGRSLT